MAVAKKPTKAAPVKRATTKAAPVKAKPKHVHPTNSAIQARKEKTHRAQIERAVRRYKEDLRKWRKVADEHPDLNRYSRHSHVRLSTLDHAIGNIADQLAIIDDLRSLKPSSQNELELRAVALLATPR